ncbi:MAG: GAF domain-containing protein [Pseudomonadota bacterium]
MHNEIYNIPIETKSDIRIVNQPVFDKEATRLKAVERSNLLDTPPEPAFDAIVRRTANQFDVPIAVFTLVDTTRCWFKSKVGVDVDHVQREIAFCNRVITTDAPLILEDVKSHEEFAGNPLVVDSPYAAFYAGVPVRSADMESIGTLCIIDTRPRTFPWQDFERLQEFAVSIEKEIETRNIVL